MISLLFKLWKRNAFQNCLDSLQNLLYGGPYYKLGYVGSSKVQYNEPKPNHYKKAISRLYHRNKFLDKTNF